MVDCPLAIGDGGEAEIDTVGGELTRKRVAGEESTELGVDELSVTRTQ